ncbi:glycosyltransferase [Providencia rettgeri]|uniref:glycosyltransferase n=2 Tax=Providencia rettgeri TaxID=587 RepID=UPI0013744D47|nr:glycosyltransferase [Providencia rettgeri]BBV06419.1 mannosyltransferase [Providencia rettgeri]
MRILHYTKYYPPFHGGIEKVTYDLVDGAIKKGHDVEVLCYEHKKERKKTEIKHNVTRSKTLFTVFKMPFSISILFSLAKKRKQCDILHVHLPNPLAMVYVLLTNLFCPKIKIIAHWHSDIVKQKTLLKIIKPIQYLFLKHADSIIVTSKPYSESSKCLSKFKDKIIVIPIGINIDGLELNIKHSENFKSINSNKKIVFSLGRLTYYKGFKYLINSANYLDDSILIIIGGVGEEKESLEKLIISNNLQDKVKLLGSIDSNLIASYYSLCDIFCLPSIERSEAFGVVQLEAMSFAKPVISTDIKGSGVSWVNKDNESGLIVKPENSKQIANAILQLANNQDLYQKLSIGAFNRFNKLFTALEMNKMTLKLYKDLLDDH